MEVSVFLMKTCKTKLNAPHLREGVLGGKEFERFMEIGLCLSEIPVGLGNASECSQCNGDPSEKMHIPTELESL